MALTIIVTDAGRAALVNAQNNGTAPVIIAQAGISATAVVPSKAATSLPGEIKRIATISGDVVADDMIHLVVRDEGGDSFTVRSFALYLADGTLFAIYGQTDPILEKSAQAMMLLAIDIAFADVDAAEISFGDANFLNPPATESMAGVVELATEPETITGVDAQRAVHAKGLRGAVTNWLNARFGEGAPSAFMKGLLTTASAAALRIALGLKGAALKDEGAGNGLDADLLDGQHGSYYTNITARLGFTPWGPSNDGAGSGLDADLLDGQQGSFYTDITARLGYTPLNAISYTAADVRAKLLTVDGSGSGIDADLLDGQQGSFYTNIIARLGYTPLDKAGDTMTGPLTVPDEVVSKGNFPRFVLHEAQSGKLWFFISDNDYVTIREDGGNGNIPFRIDAGSKQLLLTSTDIQWGGGKVWHAGNDGAGSGLDADLLDGYQASAFDRIVQQNLTANGGYVVYASGRKECWGLINVQADSYGTWNLPVAHTSWVHPVISADVQGGDNNASQNTGVTSVSGVPPTSITIWNASNTTTRVWIRTVGV